MDNLSEDTMRRGLEFSWLRPIYEALLLGPLTATEIRSKTRIKPSECSKNLDSLASKGLIIFENGKWRVTEKSKEVYKKYFE